MVGRDVIREIGQSEDVSCVSFVLSHLLFLNVCLVIVTVIR